MTTVHPLKVLDTTSIKYRKRIDSVTLSADGLHLVPFACPEMSADLPAIIQPRHCQVPELHAVVLHKLQTLSRKPQR